MSDKEPPALSRSDKEQFLKNSTQIEDHEQRRAELLQAALDKAAEVHIPRLEEKIQTMVKDLVEEMRVGKRIKTTEVNDTASMSGHLPPHLRRSRVAEAARGILKRFHRESTETQSYLEEGQTLKIKVKLVPIIPLSFNELTQNKYEFIVKAQALLQAAQDDLLKQVGQELSEKLNQRVDLEIEKPLAFQFLLHSLHQVQSLEVPATSLSEVVMGAQQAIKAVLEPSENALQSVEHRIIETLEAIKNKTEQAPRYKAQITIPLALVSEKNIDYHSVTHMGMVFGRKKYLVI